MQSIVSNVDERRLRLRVTKIAAGVIGISCVAYCLAVLIRHDKADDRMPSATNVPIIVPANGYVGSNACQDCHSKEYETWHASFHRTMTAVARPESVAGDFDDVQLDLHGRFYHLERRGDRFWVEMPDPHWLGPETEQPRIQREIVLVTGSHHFQVYWYPTGNSRILGQFPFAFLIEEKTWIPRKASFLSPPVNQLAVETGRWNYECLRCHTTGPQPRYNWSRFENPMVEDARSVDTHVAEFGISCEACHGPGEKHIWRHRNSQSVANDSDTQLVVPDQLSAQLSSHVCGQCHSAWFFRSIEEYVDWSLHGFQFRPGDDLEKVDRFILRPGSGRPEVQQRLKEFSLTDTMWPDGMIRIAGREFNGLIESPCFTHGEESRQMSCLSCHEMHPQSVDPQSLKRWANDQLKPGMRTNRACTQCHEGYTDIRTVVAHTHHPADSSGTRCLNCHMPHTTYGLLKAVRSHQISSPSVQVSVKTGRPNACNQCHLDKTFAWAADHLHDWYGIEKPELTDDEQSIAASILWTLKGDAAQRALMAWSMGWSAAHEASESDWMIPYLAQLMADPYDAVRIIAYRSLRRYNGFEEFEFDPVRPSKQKISQFLTDESSRNRNRPVRTSGRRILIDSQGNVDMTTFNRLLVQRNMRPVNISE